MNVANLELCKELYKLSDWTDTPDRWDAKKSWPIALPKYDLGYLLRKLPEIRLETWHNGHVVVKHYTTNGVPEKLERLGRVVKAEADIAEDATCKLAIDLFKQGILEREERNDQTN